MFKTFNEIKEINKLDPVTTPDLRLFKLYEEQGELVQAINILYGRKSTELDPEQVDAWILEEVSDSIQCLFSYMIELDIEMEMTPKAMQYRGIGVWFDSEGRGDWDKFIRTGDKKSLMIDFVKGLNNEVNNISSVRDSPEFYKSFFKAFVVLINIANLRGFDVETIKYKIEQKNKKWMGLVNKRVKEQKSKKIRDKAVNTLKITKGFTPEQRVYMGDLLMSCEEMASAVIDLTK